MLKVIADLIRCIDVLNGGAVCGILYYAVVPGGAINIPAVHELSVELNGVGEGSKVHAVLFERCPHVRQLVKSHAVMHVNAVLVRHHLVVSKAATHCSVRIACDGVGLPIYLLGCRDILCHFRNCRTSFCDQVIKGKQNTIGYRRTHGIGKAYAYDIEFFTACDAHGCCGSHVANEQRLDIHGRVDLLLQDLIESILHGRQVIVGLIQANKLNSDFIGILIKIDADFPGRSLCPRFRGCARSLRRIGRRST